MLSQIALSPNASPVLNDGGWVYSMAILVFVLGALVALLIVFGYMRFAPRFQRDEGAAKVVRAERIRPGKEAPRRPVKVTAAAPVPAPVAAVAAVAAVAPDLAALAAVPAAPSALPAPVAAAPAAAATAVPAIPAVTAGVPDAAAPGITPARTDAAGAASGAPGGGAGMAKERKEVALDQETFDRVLAELLEKGTSRRVAEGQARRAAMIAARKKAEG